MPSLWGCACIFIVIGCNKDKGTTDEATVSEVGSGIVVIQAYSYPAESGSVGVAYVSIANAGPGDDRLLSVKSPVCQKVEMHDTINEEGVMKMKHQDFGFAIAAGKELVMKPGGSHLMLLGTKAPVVGGQAFKMTLNFEKADALEIEVQVNQ